MVVINGHRIAGAGRESREFKSHWCFRHINRSAKPMSNQTFADENMNGVSNDLQSVRFTTGHITPYTGDMASDGRSERRPRSREEARHQFLEVVAVIAPAVLCELAGEPLESFRLFRESVKAHCPDKTDPYSRLELSRVQANHGYSHPSDAPAEVLQAVRRIDAALDSWLTNWNFSANWLRRQAEWTLHVWGQNTSKGMRLYWDPLPISTTAYRRPHIDLREAVPHLAWSPNSGISRPFVRNAGTRGLHRGSQGLYGRTGGVWAWRDRPLSF